MLRVWMTRMRKAVPLLPAASYFGASSLPHRSSVFVFTLFKIFSAVIKKAAMKQ